MDYIEEYLKYQLSNDEIRVTKFVVDRDKIEIDYFICNEPHFEIVHRYFESSYNRYFEWKKLYLRKNKLNKIRYAIYTTSTTT